jgi:hypothetical protein
MSIQGYQNGISFIIAVVNELKLLRCDIRDVSQKSIGTSFSCRHLLLCLLSKPSRYPWVTQINFHRFVTECI